jgi:hypothetical protein
MYSHHSRKPWAAVAAMSLVVAACGQDAQIPATGSDSAASSLEMGTSTKVGAESAGVEPSLGLEPRTGAPATLVLVRSDSCPPQPGADFYAIHVKLLPPGGSFADDWLATGGVLRSLVPPRPPTASASPSYGPLPEGAGALNDDG